MNRCRRGLRRTAARREREEPLDALAPGGTGAGELDVAAAASDRRALEQAFERLSADQRTLLVLHYLEGRPVTAVAAVLRVPEGTAASRLFAARRSLERELEREGAR